MKACVTGAKGFIAGYLIDDLLRHGWEVVGVDNLSKYGLVRKSYDKHPKYQFVQGDAKDASLMKEVIADCDHFVAGAAMIGGISYFHELAFDLLAENERITAATFEAAIYAHRFGKLKKITVLSSSMVFETATHFPTREGEQLKCPPPLSTYGFQKLATEYFAKGAWQQYKLPYTICRPFNCIGTGEKRAIVDKEVMSGNVKLAMSHVVPDLAQKIIKGQDPLHILGDGRQVRHYTYGGDLATGIRMCIESERALNEDFNLSTSESTTVLELATKMWKMIRGDAPFAFVSDPPFEYDVRKRIPDTEKARQMLGFQASTTLDASLREIIPWIQEEITLGGI